MSSHPARVLRPAELPAIDRGGGARTVPLVTGDRGATTFLNGITRFDPGAEIAHHRHDCAESVLIVAGDAVLDVDGVEIPLHRLDTTFVPANVPHHFRNASTTEPMAIFWTYASVDATRTVLATGVQARIDAEQGTRRAGRVTEFVDAVVRPESEEAFEAAVAEAAPLFQRATGCLSFQLTRSAETPLHYRLLIGWASIEDHLTGFRSAPEFALWRELVTPHLAAPLVSGHLTHVLNGF